jgi:hypothetical protein
MMIILVFFKKTQIKRGSHVRGRKTKRRGKTQTSWFIYEGMNTVFIGSEGIERCWQSISNKRSPYYITGWQDLIKVMYHE